VFTDKVFAIIQKNVNPDMSCTMFSSCWK